LCASLISGTTAGTCTGSSQKNLLYCTEVLEYGRLERLAKDGFEFERTSYSSDLPELSRYGSLGHLLR
jgi:hypothetical protein